MLDEPTAGMDPEARRATRALLAGLRAEGRAILLTTHDLGDVERLADRVAILDAGRIVASGTPAELAAGAVPRLRFRLVRGLDDGELSALGRALADTARPAAAAPGGAGAGARRRARRGAGGLPRRRPAAGSRARRDAGGLVRGSRAPDRRAPGGRGHARGALPRADRRSRRRGRHMSRPASSFGAVGALARPRAQADRAARRERPRHARHPGERARLLRDRRRRPGNRGPRGRLPAPRVARPRDHRERAGQPRDHHRLRARATAS